MAKEKEDRSKVHHPFVIFFCGGSCGFLSHFLHIFTPYILRTSTYLYLVVLGLATILPPQLEFSTCIYLVPICYIVIKCSDLFFLWLGRKPKLAFRELLDRVLDQCAS